MKSLWRERDKNFKITSTDHVDFFLKISSGRDETLFRNIARAHRYFGMILAGKSYCEIAEAEGGTVRRSRLETGTARA